MSKQPADSGRSGLRLQHVVALSHPDATEWVPVVTVSHNHPEHMGATKNAHLFDSYTREQGRGGFESGSRIATARPVHVHVDDLHHVSDAGDLPTYLVHKDIHLIKDDVRE